MKKEVKSQRQVVQGIFSTISYARLPKSILRMKEISTVSKLILMYFYDCIRQEEGDGLCFPKIRTISIELKIPPRTIKRAIEELRVYRLLKSVRYGQLRRNLYVLQDIPKWIPEKYPDPKKRKSQGATQAPCTGPHRPHNKGDKENISTLDRVDRENHSETSVQERLRELEAEKVPLSFGSKKVRDGDGSYHLELNWEGE